MSSVCHWKRFRRSLPRAVAALTCAGVITVAAPAWSQDSAYCKKVRARASGDAALLFAPTVQAQAIKFPNNGTTDAGVTTGAGYQFRAALSFSPLDFYKGFRVQQVGDADCEQHEAVVSAQQVLAQGADYGRLPALRKQVEFLDRRRPTWEAVLAKSEERVAAHVESLREAMEIRSRIMALGRAREHVQGDVDRLEARGIEAYRGPLSVLVDAADRQVMQLERKASHVRSLDAWDVRVVGGVIPQAAPVDYYGMLQVGFNLGAFSRNAQETRYLDARAEELKKARYELRDQVDKFRAQMRSAIAQAKRELIVIERQRAMLAADRTALGQADAPNAPHALAMIDLDAVLVESERVFLETLITELSHFQENDNAS